jgi:hypothetical protein
LKKFTDLGLSDVHLQSFDMVPQWMPQSWEVTATGGGKALKLDTAQPSYGSSGTTGPGLDLDVATLDSAAKPISRGGMFGERVLLFSMPRPVMAPRRRPNRRSAGRKTSAGARPSFV